MKCGKTIRVNIKGEAHHLPYKLRDSPIMWGYHLVEKHLNSETEQTAHQQKKAFWWLSFVAFFSVMNETVFNVALPDIAKDFGVQPSAASWVNTGFIISFAVGSMVYSRISDMYGLKRPLVIGLFIYGGGSLLGLLAHAFFRPSFSRVLFKEQAHRLYRRLSWS